MHRISSVVLFATIVGLALAQSTSVNVLTSGNAVTTALTPTLSEDNSKWLVYYSIWVPENASSVTIDFDVLTTPVECSYLHVFQRVQGLPCPDYYDNDEFTCYSDSYNPGDGVSGTNTYTHTAGSDNVNWQTNTWWYIGVGRYSSSDYDIACPYTLKATVTTCPAGQIGAYDGSAACVPIVEQTGDNITLSVAAENQVVKRLLPFNTGMVNITVTSNTTSLYLYGKAGGVPSSSYYNCYTSAYTTVGTDTYVYNLACAVPYQNAFFYLWLDQSTTTLYTATVDVKPIVCPAGFGGYNCLYPNTNLTNAPITPISLAEDDYPLAPGGAFQFFYFDLAPAVANNNVTFTVSANSAGGSGYLYWRRNAWMDYNSNTNDGSPYEQSLSSTVPTVFTLTKYDLYAGGRYFFGIEAYTGNVTVTLTPVSITSAGSTGGVTGASSAGTTGTGSVTAAATTGSEDSAASTVAASILAVAMMLAVMF